MRMAWLLVVVVTSLAAYVARSVAVALTRRRHPAVAAAVDRWWAWTPAVVVLVLAIRANPWIGGPLAAAAAWALTRSWAVGSPFRPRGP